MTLRLDRFMRGPAGLTLDTTRRQWYYDAERLTDLAKSWC